MMRTAGGCSDLAKGFVGGCASIVFSAVVFFPVAFIMLHSNTATPHAAMDRGLFNVSTDAPSSKPAEMAVYEAACLFFPFSIWFFTRLFSRLSVKRLESYFPWGAIALATPIVLIASFKEEALDLRGITGWSEAVRSPFLFLFATAMFLWFMSSGYCRLWLNETAQKLIFRFFIALAFVYSLEAGAWRILGNADEYSGSVNFSAVYSSMAQVFYGKVLLADYINTYGLYPHFLHPVFSLTGLDPLRFTICMALLTVLSLGLLILFLKKAIHNRWIAISAMFGVIETCCFYRTLDLGDPYFQYVPIRLIFPALLFYLSADFFHRPMRRKYYGVFAVLSLGILWNLELGIICCLTWLGTLCFNEVLQKTTFRATAARCLRHFIAALASAAAVFGAYALLIDIFYKKAPNIFNLGLVQRLYLNSGSFMLSTPIFHVWNFFALACAAGLGCAAACLVGNTKQPRSGLQIFMVTIFSMGAFSYYMCRSVTSNLLGAPGFALLILLCLFCDGLWDHVRSNDTEKKLSWALFLPCFLPLAGILFHIPFQQDQIRRDLAERIDAIGHEDSDPKLIEMSSLKGHIRPGEPSLIFSLAAGAVHTLIGSPPAGFDSFAELWRKSDHLEIQRILSGRLCRVIFLDKKFDLRGAYPEFEDLLQRNYRMTADKAPARYQVFIKR